MEQDRITEIIRDVIDTAARNQGWSLAQLTRQLGKGDNTLHRWRMGTTTSYDMFTVIKLFKMAGKSMDDLFEIPVDGQPEVTQSQVDRLNAEITSIKNDLQLLTPVANLVQALAGVAANTQTIQGAMTNGRDQRKAG